MIKAKKRILFVMTSLSTGGITTSLINLLRELDKSQEYTIDLFLFNKDSGRVDDVPASVNILGGNAVLRLITISQRDARKAGWFWWFLRFLYVAICRLFGSGVAYRLAILTSRIPESYDYAISCTQSAPRHVFYGGCNEFVLYKVKATEKLSFIHCDYLSYGLNCEYNSKLYRKFDRVAAVSESCREVFLKAIPDMAEKTCVVRNCLDYEGIRALSSEDTVTYTENGLNIITVARIGMEKGHFRTLEALQRLKQEGFSFGWHLIGGGNTVIIDRLCKSIETMELADRVVYHDNQRNPYRFFPNADFMLLPSFHEAAPMVFGEAICLKTPILTTRTTSADELVADHGFGIVCENSIDGIYQGLKTILQNPQVLVTVIENMEAFSGDSLLNNDKEVAQFISFLTSNRKEADPV